MNLQMKEDLDVDSKSRFGQPNFKCMEEIRMLYRSARLQGIKKKGVGKTYETMER